VVSALDLPSEPEEAAPAERVGDSGADRPSAREVSDPDERERAYEAIRTHVSAETRDGPEAGRPADGTDRRGYWDEVPRFLSMWAKHEKDWPESQRPAPDRSADLPGSYRSDGGFYLKPERHAEAVAAIGRIREAEPAISADVQTVEQENEQGGRLEGLMCRLKGDDRLKEKVAAQLAVEPDKPAFEILRKIPDAIRYTFCFESGNYTKGYYDIKDQLESRGHEMYYSKNWWTNPEYKGINTRWVTAAGQRFEIQFHTPESFHAKQCVTHDAYERNRNPLTSDGERDELEEFQREVSSCIQIPEGAVDIPDFKKEGF
jgi:hypothetical protein